VTNIRLSDVYKEQTTVRRGRSVVSVWRRPMLIKAASINLECTSLDRTDLDLTNRDRINLKFQIFEIGAAEIWIVQIWTVHIWTYNFLIWAIFWHSLSPYEKFLALKCKFQMCTVQICTFQICAVPILKFEIPDLCGPGFYALLLRNYRLHSNSISSY